MATSKNAFPGIKAENSESIENLILEILRDHFFLRRNFHPEDKPKISEDDKTSVSNIDFNNILRQELFQILSELKGGVPFFSDRYLGHLTGDILIPAFVGYFAGMLYNQNNCAGEGAPITVKKEMEFIYDLAKMIGYEKEILPSTVEEFIKSIPNTNKKIPWGHLSSGGTSANIEALWVARNVKFYPIFLKIVSIEKKDEYSFIETLMLNDINVKISNKKKFVELSNFELLNLSTDNILNLFFELMNKNQIEFSKLQKEIHNIGMDKLIRFLSKDENGNDTNFEMPKVLIPQTVHYCWYKAMDILGLGIENLVEIEVDNTFRMDMVKLEAKVNELKSKGKNILAIIGVSGTTEEGAFDKFDKIIELSEKMKKDNYNFWIHSDAAFGGYFACVKNDEKILDKCFSELYDDRSKSLSALKQIDSIVIDPHKLGYIPYPAGALIFKDSRIRNFIEYKAEYIKDAKDSIQNLNLAHSHIGSWTLEGSRPGSAAISCYLATKCVRLDMEGYGEILFNCLEATQGLYNAIVETNTKGFKITSVFKPQSIAICYFIYSDTYLLKPNWLNRLNEKIYERLSISSTYHINKYEYVVAKTEFSAADSKYALQINSLLQQQGVIEPDEKLQQEFKLLTLRSVMMNPFPGLLKENKMKDFFNNYCANICNIADEEIISVYEEALGNHSGRFKVLHIEDDVSLCKGLKEKIEKRASVSQYFNYDYVDTESEFFSKLKNIPDICIIDLHFNEGAFKGLEIISEIKNKKKENEELKKCKLLVYSLYAEDDYIRRELINEHEINEDYIIMKTEKDINNENIEETEIKKIVNRMIYALT